MTLARLATQWHAKHLSGSFATFQVIEFHSDKKSEIELRPKQKMKNTRFTWKTLISGKNHGNRKFHYEKIAEYNHRTIKPDLVWECAETTISAKRIQPYHTDVYSFWSFPSFSVFHSLFLFWFSLLFFSLSFWVRILLHSHYCVENSVVLRVTHTSNSYFHSYLYIYYSYNTHLPYTYIFPFFSLFYF